MPGLWLQVITPPRPNPGERFDSRHLIRKQGMKAGSHAGTGQAVQPCFLCWDYNTRGTCSSARNADLGMNAQCAGVSILAYLVLELEPRGMLIRQQEIIKRSSGGAPLEKGPSPIKLEVLGDWLVDYP